MIGAAAALWIALAAPVRADLPDEHVVARARAPHGEIVITAGRLRAYAEGREHLPPRRLIQDLVDFELLAAEAERRFGDDPGPEVREAVAEVLVQRYLAEDYEKSVTPAAIPHKHVQQAYDKNRSHFVHPELRNADHIVVTLDGKRPEDEALDAKARSIAERLHAELVARPPADEADFAARAAQYAEEGKALGLIVRAEQLGLFSRKGRFDPAFTEQAFTLTEPGAIGRPFATRFGWHVVRVREARPASNRSLKDVESEIRERIVEEYRRFRLRELTDELGRAAGALFDPEPLEQLEQRRGLEKAGEAEAPAEAPPE